MLEISAAARTHVGKVRSKNEDSFCVEQGLGLFLVADGMGGHASGEVASRMAVEVIKETYEKSVEQNSPILVGKRDPRFSMAANWLLSSIRFANRAVFEVAQEEHAYNGMGTTLAGLLARWDKIIQIHVGDSRIYRVRKETVEQLSEDHSLVAQQLKMGLLTAEEVKVSPAKNVITRAIGIHKDVEIDVRQHRWMEGDTYLLCSDGFSDVVAQDKILDILDRNDYNPDASSDALIKEALDSGGHDNITVVLVRLGKRTSRMRQVRETISRLLGFLSRVKASENKDSLVT
jgi:serine/threonine protein phosphatase PrpC